MAWLLASARAHSVGARWLAADTLDSCTNHLHHLARLESSDTQWLPIVQFSPQLQMMLPGCAAAQPAAVNPTPHGWPNWRWLRASRGRTVLDTPLTDHCITLVARSVALAGQHVTNAGVAEHHQQSARYVYGCSLWLARDDRSPFKFKFSTYYYY